MKHNNKNGKVVSSLGFFLILVIGVLLSAPLPAQQGSLQALDFDRVQADEAFRDGVLFLHASRTNDAIVAFQRALSFKPDDVLARLWLGRAYYFGGYEEAAEVEWRQVQVLGGGTPALQSFLNTLDNRRGFGTEIQEDQEFFPVAAFSLALPGGVSDLRVGSEINATSQTTTMGSMPGTLALRPDGWFYVANFSQDSIQVYDVNGRLRQTFTGGIQGFSGPFGLSLLPNSRLVVTSFRGDRVDIIDGVSGNILSTFGEKGIGSGQFLGPQFIAFDPQGYLFITDYGNQRIQKWTTEGEFVLSFGGDQTFHRVGGIAFFNDRVYVLELREGLGVLRTFDAFGNERDLPLESTLLDKAESIKVDPRGNMLVTSPKGLLVFDPENRSLRRVFASVEDQDQGFVFGDLDVNGNVLMSDVRRREILFLSRLSGLYSGLHVQINRVVADEFPLVNIEVAVEDRTGAPVLGLDGINFSVTEGGSGIGESVMLRRGYQIDEMGLQVVVTPSRVVPGTEYRVSVSDVISRIWNALPARDSVSIVNAGETPQILAESRGTYQDSQRLSQSVVYSPNWAMDLALRLSGNLLVREDRIRHLLVVGDGELQDN
ncbi:MAG: hypothetical protein GW949_10935, partial [Spirochaetales bacterium]|nr:hypothetical protein [Spirochaetales bacterium]